MPIRFRCAYCNQLMGIARRKSGTVVRCPTCAGQVVVPQSDTEPGPKPGSDADEPIFERSEFAQLLSETEGKPQGAAVATGRAPGSADPPVGAWGTFAEPAYDKFDLPQSAAARGRAPAVPVQGIWMTPRKATLLTVLAILALALAFGAGFLTCYLLRPVPAITTALLTSVF
jgi:hypothetical protein